MGTSRAHVGLVSRCFWCAALADIKFFFHAVCALELKKLETQIEQKYSSF